MRSSKKKSAKKAPKVEVYDVRKEARKRAKKTYIWVRKHPWESIGLAALIGAFIARTFFRRKR